MRERPDRRRSSQDEPSMSDLFWGVARRFRHTSSEALAPWDISPSQHRALQVLRRGGPMRAGRLSDFLRIAPRSVTEVIDAMEGRGLVERSADPDDRRATQIELTDEGVRVVEAIYQAQLTEADQLFGQLSETDRSHLMRILRKLNE